MVRKPMRCASSWPSGNSSPAAERSCTCTGMRSITARPVGQRLVMGILTQSMGIGPWCALTTSDSPSRRRIDASWASHRRAADCATVLSTPCRSAGERLMMRRISAVAACCSRKSASSRAPSSSERAGTPLVRRLMKSQNSMRPPVSREPAAQARSYHNPKPPSHSVMLRREGAFLPRVDFDTVRKVCFMTLSSKNVVARLSRRVFSCPGERRDCVHGTNQMKESTLSIL